MKALILAAGRGSRLAPLTDDKPKTLVEVNGISILGKQIENLIKYGINDIIVVTGYLYNKIVDFLNHKYPFVKTIVIPEYNSTNNMYSAYKAMNYLANTDFLMMNGDVFFDAEIINNLINCSSANAIAVQPNTYIEESMKVVAVNDRVIHISKTIDPQYAYGVSIDLYKFSPAGSKRFFNIAAEYIEVFGEKKLWSEVALDKTLDSIEFGICNVYNKWIEIDNFEDLKKAEELFA